MLEGLSKPTRTFSWVSRNPGRDTNQVSPEYSHKSIITGAVLLGGMGLLQMDRPINIRGY